MPSFLRNLFDRLPTGTLALVCSVLPGARVSNGAVELPVTDRAINDLLTSNEITPPVRLHFEPGMLLVCADVAVAGGTVTAESRFRIASWRIDARHAVIELEPIGSVHLGGRGLLARAALAGQTLLWGSNRDERVFEEVAARLEGVSWTNGRLRCDLDCIEEVRSRLRAPVLDLQLLDLVEVADLRITAGTLCLVIAPRGIESRGIGMAAGVCQ